MQTATTVVVTALTLFAYAGEIICLLSVQWFNRTAKRGICTHYVCPHTLREYLKTLRFLEFT